MVVKSETGVAGRMVCRAGCLKQNMSWYAGWYITSIANTSKPPFCLYNVITSDRVSWGCTWEAVQLSSSRTWALVMAGKFEPMVILFIFSAKRYFFGISVDQLRWYVALSLWKLTWACPLVGSMFQLSGQKIQAKSWLLDSTGKVQHSIDPILVGTSLPWSMPVLCKPTITKKSLTPTRGWFYSSMTQCIYDTKPNPPVPSYFQWNISKWLAAQEPKRRTWVATCTGRWLKEYAELYHIL